MLKDDIYIKVNAITYRYVVIDIFYHYVSLWNIDALVENNEGSGIQEFYPAGIGIGSNGAGELIALEHLGLNVFRVILTPFIGMDCPIEIGESFIDFLIRLDNGRNWFE